MHLPLFKANSRYLAMMLDRARRLVVICMLTGQPDTQPTTAQLRASRSGTPWSSSESIITRSLRKAGIPMPVFTMSMARSSAASETFG